MVADPVPTRLEVAPDATTLLAAEKDAVRVIVRALDQAGALLPFLADPVEVRVEGPARLIGPGAADARRRHGRVLAGVGRQRSAR